MNTGSSHNRCQQCKEKIATHFCLDCGTLLCADCLAERESIYYFCTECHQFFTSDEKPEKCPDCETESIDKGRKVESVCPRCNSKKLVQVEEYRKRLAQNLRNAVLGLQYGHVKLREIGRKITSAKQLLVSLRRDKFQHYKWLEKEIEEILEETPTLKERIVKQAGIIAKQMAAETFGLLDYSSWTTEQFPFIKGVTERIQELAEQYRRHVDDTLQQIRKKVQELVQHLKGLEYYRNAFEEFYEYSELSVNELPVCAFTEVRIAGSDFLKQDKAEGILFITNERMIFVARVGTFRKKKEIVFDFPLFYFNGFEEEGRFRKKIVLKLKQGYLKIACNEQTQRVLPDYLEIARKFDRYAQFDMQRVRRIEQSNVNMDDARLKIDEYVYLVFSKRREISNRQGFMNIEDRIFEPTISREDWPVNNRTFAFPSRYSDFPQTGKTYEPLDMWRTGGNPQQMPEVIRLQETARSLDDEIRTTIHLFRNGKMGPEDFVRRYRGLVRESYSIRQRIDQLTQERYHHL